MDKLKLPELAALYEPAFAAAGERPRRGRYRLMFEFATGWNPPAAWLLPVNECATDAPRGASVMTEDAANACRCWAEDWLVREAGEITLADHSRTGGVARVTLGDSRLTCSKMWAGDTLDHALAAAVIAVAKQRNAGGTPAPLSS